MKDIVWKIKSFEKLSTQELYAILMVRQEVFIVEQTCYYLDADGYDEKALHRIEQLRESVGHILAILDEAKGRNKKLKIKSFIEIEYED